MTEQLVLKEPADERIEVVELVWRSYPDHVWGWRVRKGPIEVNVEEGSLLGLRIRLAKLRVERRYRSLRRGVESVNGGTA